jgi:hypothetical protein
LDYNKQNALSNASAVLVYFNINSGTFNNKQNALSNASASVSGILTSTDYLIINKML